MKTLDQISTIGVAGAGVMGSGIAQVFAQAGYTVLLYDAFQESLDKGKANIEAFTNKAVEKGKMTEAVRAATLERISYTTLVNDLTADLVLEAIPEKLELKHHLFDKLEEINGPDTLLATNTSSISITALAGKLQHPERLVGLHFFNPAPLMKLVEVIAHERTAPEVTQLAEELAVKLGKVPAQVADTPGFIVNRVARFFYLESLRVLEERVADHQSIDRIMKSLGFRMGPFELMDLIGVDTNHLVTQTIYQDFFHEPRFRPSRIQQKKVEAGAWGKKAGRGFYDYNN